MTFAWTFSAIDCNLCCPAIHLQGVSRGYEVDPLYEVGEWVIWRISADDLLRWLPRFLVFAEYLGSSWWTISFTTIFPRHFAIELTWSIMTPNLRMPVALFPCNVKNKWTEEVERNKHLTEYVISETVPPVADDWVLIRSAWSLEENQSGP